LVNSQLHKAPDVVSVNISAKPPTRCKTKKIFKGKLEFVPLQSMKKESISKKTILKSVAKMVTDKEFVRSYIKGKTPIQTLTKKGIKFAKPL
jgi:hypothetical protein